MRMMLTFAIVTAATAAVVGGVGRYRKLAREAAYTEAVYSAAFQYLADRRTDNRPFVVQPLAADPLHMEAKSWTLACQSVPTDLRVRFEQPRAPRRQHIQAAFPPNVSFVPQEQIDAAANDTAPHTDRWPYINGLSPTNGTYAVSIPVFSDSNIDSLISVEYSCSPNCASGELLWMRRDTPGNNWHVQEACTGWVA